MQKFQTRSLFYTLHNNQRKTDQGSKLETKSMELIEKSTAKHCKTAAYVKTFWKDSTAKAIQEKIKMGIT